MNGMHITVNRNGRSILPTEIYSLKLRFVEIFYIPRSMAFPRQELIS